VSDIENSDNHTLSWPHLIAWAVLVLSIGGLFWLGTDDVSAFLAVLLIGTGVAAWAVLYAIARDGGTAGSDGPRYTWIEPGRQVGLATAGTELGDDEIETGTYGLVFDDGHESAFVVAGGPDDLRDFAARVQALVDSHPNGHDDTVAD
jgi:hypothetical protein